ncbi:hypothetical protein C8F01DRAFT_383 [Mycena amicta]|nr:hypothetical protein C8F01DRAFT_383 [Mycena amicta]
MFSFTTIASSAFVFLVASQSVLATPQPMPAAHTLDLNLHSLSFRSKTDGEPDIVPQCEKTCDKLQDILFDDSSTAASLCTSTIIGMFQTCFDCEVGAGAATAESLQPQVNEFVSSCIRANHPVANFTVTAKTGSALRGVQLQKGVLTVAGSVIAGLTAVSFALL